jgi:hypothetical protein
MDMTEEAINAAVTTQEVGTPEKSTEVNASQPQTSEPAQGSKEYNFRKLESEKFEIERRYREQESLNKELIGALRGNLQPKPQLQEEALPELSPNDIPEWKDVKSYAERIAEKKFQELMAKQEKERLPGVVKQKFQDFDKVVTHERIQTLERNNPELADAFTRASDPFTATYSYFKALYREEPKKQDPVALEEAQKIIENAKKPVSSNAVGSTGALKNAQAFAKKDKDALYKEMMSAAARAI